MARRLVKCPFDLTDEAADGAADVASGRCRWRRLPHLRFGAARAKIHLWRTDCRILRRPWSPMPSTVSKFAESPFYGVLMKCYWFWCRCGTGVYQPVRCTASCALTKPCSTRTTVSVIGGTTSNATNQLLSTPSTRTSTKTRTATPSKRYFNDSFPHSSWGS